jgi:hypothetical protein
MPRRRTPTAAKIRGGSYRPSTARDDLELPAGVPRAPDWLEKAARQEWTRVVRELSEAGALAKLHRSALTVYCVAWGAYEKAKGKVTTAQLGELRRMMVELNLTPKTTTIRPAEPTRTPESAARPTNVTALADIHARMASLAGISRGLPKPADKPTEETKP